MYQSVEFVKAFEEAIISTPSSYLWAVVLASVVIMTVMSFILNHHWKKYGMSNTVVRSGRALYFAGMIVLFVVMLGAAMAFETVRISYI